VLVAGGLLVGASFMLVATTNSLWQWYLFLSINTACRQLILFIPIQSLISRWFLRRRGFALGVTAAASAVGGLIIVPVLRILIDQFGWETSFVVTGVAVAATFVPFGLFVVRDSPADMGTYPDGEPPAEHDPAVPAPALGVSLSTAVRTPIFWALTLGLGVFFYSFFGFMVHQVPYYESVGISRSMAATFVAIMAGVTIFSRLIIGELGDRIDRVERLAMALCACLMAGMATLLLNSSYGGISIFLVFFILGSGAGPVLQPLLLMRTFGVSNYGSIMGASIVVQTTAMTFSPVIAGAIFDGTGSYQWVLVMFLCTFGVALTLFTIASRLPHPEWDESAPASTLELAPATGGS
jgi:nitrate/nitrite transporter NarK